MLVQLVITFILIAAGSCLRTNQGREFMLPFMKPYDSVKLMIITDKPTSVAITTHEAVTILTLGAETTHTAGLNEVGYDGAFSMSTQPTAVSVTADEDIWLYVFFNDTHSDHAGFMAIPVEHLSADYTVVTYEKNTNAGVHNFFLVAAVEDNTTVSFLVNTGANVFCESVNASNLDIGVVTLNRSDVDGFICSEDITGTRIQSNKDVVVVSGRGCFDSVSGSCSLMIEMMIPMKTFGTEFFLPAPRPGDSAIYRVVPSKTPTTIKTQTGKEYIIGDVGFVDINSSSVIIETSNPSTVVIINKLIQVGSGASSMSVSDNDMSILPSTDRFLKGYVTDELFYRDEFLEPDTVSVFGWNENDDCSLSSLLNCDWFEMTMEVKQTVKMDNVANTIKPRGTIFYRPSQDVNTMASFPLGMLFDTDECSSSPCYNNATCEDGSYSFVCHCPPGFNGTLCDIDIDECISDPCENNATCLDEINGFVCQCEPGFNGTLCEIDIDECASQPCQNNATCLNEINSFVCQCEPGFNGTFCETDIDECFGNPCQNNGICEDEINGFVCRCEPGFNGTFCETDIDECASQPCQNNATCLNEINNFVCQCEPGFNGTFCEADIDECLGSPCQNNATCADGINGFVCQCTPGFTGDRCDTDIDECAGDPCQNNATCQDKTNGFVCQCELGFSGTFCETDLNECARNPCRNNATCREENNGFVCQCQQGFSGILCETDIDECTSNPCENAGTYDNIPGGFACRCDTGFYGTMCESAGFEYTFTRLISADSTLVTSSGVTVAGGPLETDIRFETCYTTPLVIQNTQGNKGNSEYDCVCTRYGNNSGTIVDPKVLIDRIQENLLVDKDKLIKTFIKYNSLEDDRPSAKGIGSVGCMIIIGSVLLVVVPDVFYFLREWDNRKINVKPQNTEP